MHQGELRLELRLKIIYVHARVAATDKDVGAGHKTIVADHPRQENLASSGLTAFARSELWVAETGQVRLAVQPARSLTGPRERKDPARIKSQAFTCRAVTDEDS